MTLEPKRWRAVIKIDSKNELGKLNFFVDRAMEARAGRRDIAVPNAVLGSHLGIVDYIHVAESTEVATSP